MSEAAPTDQVPMLGEPALFNLVIKVTSGTVHLATRAKALCGRSMRQPKYVVSPTWWDERCAECFGRLG